MTVLRPSLPPVSWMTTRMLSRAPGWPAGLACAAVRHRKPGTPAPSAMRLDDLRNERRVNIGDLLWSYGHSVSVSNACHQVSIYLGAANWPLSPFPGLFSNELVNKQFRMSLSQSLDLGSATIFLAQARVAGSTIR